MYEEFVQFRTWLLDEMARREISQTELARRSKMSPSIISRWLTGVHRPEAGNLLKIADALGVDHAVVFEIAGLPAQTPKIPQMSQSISLVGMVERIDWRKYPDVYIAVDGILRGLLERERLGRE